MRDQIRVRAEFPESANRTFLMHDQRRWTYAQFRDEAVARRALRARPARRGRRTPAQPHVAMLLENHLELLALYGGCAVAGATLFGVNTGLRGETLAGVLNQSRARLLVVEEKLLPEVDRIRRELRHVAPENLLSTREFSRGRRRARPGPPRSPCPSPTRR